MKSTPIEFYCWNEHTHFETKDIIVYGDGDIKAQACPHCDEEHWN